MCAERENRGGTGAWHQLKFESVDRREIVREFLLGVSFFALGAALKMVLDEDGTDPINLVGNTGLEPVTSTMSMWRSSQLS